MLRLAAAVAVAVLAVINQVVQRNQEQVVVHLTVALVQQEELAVRVQEHSRDMLLREEVEVHSLLAVAAVTAAVAVLAKFPRTILQAQLMVDLAVGQEG